jgi:prefoldin subunit 5
MKKEEELQRDYIELQLLENQLRQVTQQLSVLEQHIHELLIVEACSNNVTDLKKGNTILVPFPSGIFVMQI